jgi:Flp pilus assembly protein TadG
VSLISAIQHLFRRFIGGSGVAIGGAAAVEFAVIAPLLTAMLIFVTDLGLGFYRKMQVENAAQAGAQYAAVNGFSTSGVSSAVLAATNFSAISASPAPTQFCGCPTSTGVTAAASCSSACSGGSAPGTYVTVSAQASYSTVFNYPGMASSYNFTAQATVRVQ